MPRLTATDIAPALSPTPSFSYACFRRTFTPSSDMPSLSAIALLLRPWTSSSTASRSADVSSGSSLLALYIALMSSGMNVPPSATARTAFTMFSGLRSFSTYPFAPAFSAA